jgi:predicted nuclease of predicted toxin-antitoxin system
VRFLIDECLSVDLVTVAGESGHEAQHVAHVGRAGWKDWNVERYAGERDFILVTDSASDFRQLYATQPLQWAWSRRAMQCVMVRRKADRRA